MKQPEEGDPNTRSYDRPQSEEGERPSPSPRANPATRVLPDGRADGQGNGGATFRERPMRTDPLAVGPPPKAPLLLEPSQAPPPASPATNEPPADVFIAGTQVDHFEILGLIGKGGMGCVYKALDRDLGRTVAIKTLHGINQPQPNALARFRREAQAASRVVHPNLVIIYSFGTHGDTPYIVMEYLSGRSLAEEIARSPLAVERAADILVPACAGVYAAHRAGVVHRDLKPANIFLARTPMGETIKILDFGISRIGNDDANLTGTGDIIGTTYYLAPEQASGHEVDARADQYALGVILYECLTGVRPFAGSVIYAILRNIVEGVFQPPSLVRPDIPASLETVILRAMSREPRDRFARVRDLGLALMPFMSAEMRQQWSHHFTAPEAEMPIAPSAPVPVPAGSEAPLAPSKITPMRPAEVRPPTKLLPDAPPDTWQLSPTHTADEPVSLPLPVSAPDETGLVPAARRSHIVALAATSALVALLAIVAWLWRSSTTDQAARSASPGAALPAPARPQVPAAPAPVPGTPPSPGVLPSEPSERGVATKSAVPSSPSRPAAQPAKDSAKSRPRKTKQARQPSVKFTPEGVPII